MLRDLGYIYIYISKKGKLFRFRFRFVLSLYHLVLAFFFYIVSIFFFFFFFSLHVLIYIFLYRRHQIITDGIVRDFNVLPNDDTYDSTTSSFFIRIIQNTKHREHRETTIELHLYIPYSRYYYSSG